MRIEYRTTSGPALAADIALHLQKRLSAGPAVVVTDRPVGFLSQLRKQWLRRGRALQRERAATLDAAKIAILLQVLASMHHATFSAADNPQTADVRIVTPDDLASLHYTIATVYICVPLTNEQLKIAGSRLAHKGLVVDYK